MSKYGAQKVVTAHGAFDSKAEAVWFHGLFLRFKAGEITHLLRQQTFPLIVNELRVCSVILDATWKENGVEQFADFKGMMTPSASLKFKLFEAIYDSPVRVFTSKGEKKTRRVRPLKKASRRRAPATPAQAST